MIVVISQNTWSYPPVVDAPPLPYRSVVVLATRDEFLVGSPDSKVHSALRGDGHGATVARCKSRLGRTATTWTGRCTEITCSKCSDLFWIDVYGEQMSADGLFGR